MQDNWTRKLLWVLAAGVLAAGALRAAQAQGGCLGNAKQLGTALLMYVQDYDEKLPPVTTPAAMKKVLLPYVRKEAVFVCVVSGKPFAWNRAISRKPMGAIKSPATVVSCYDAEAHDGKRVVGYLDGHAKGIAEVEFAALKKSGAVK